MKHKDIFSDGKNRERCGIGHIYKLNTYERCIRCEHCHEWIEWPYDSECTKIANNNIKCKQQESLDKLKIENEQLKEDNKILTEYCDLLLKMTFIKTLIP